MDIRYETLGWQIRPLQFWKSVYPYCYLRLLKELEDTVSFKSECDNDSLTSVISSLELVWLSRAQSSRFVLIWRVDIHVLCSIEKGWNGLRFRSESEEIQIMKDKVGVGAKQFLKSNPSRSNAWSRVTESVWSSWLKTWPSAAPWKSTGPILIMTQSSLAFVISIITFFTSLLVFTNGLILSPPELRKII